MQKDEVLESLSSKIEKPSAIDLLDEVLEEQNYSSTKTQPKFQQNQFKQRAGTYTQKNNNINLLQQYTTNSKISHNATDKNSAINFNQFDFWTSNITSKNDGELRNKSATLVNKTNSLNINLGGSPQMNKNVSTGVQNYYNLQQHQNTNPSSMMLSMTQPVRLKGSSQKHDEDFSIFTVGIEQQISKKSSPYAKK